MDGVCQSARFRVLEYVNDQQSFLGTKRTGPDYLGEVLLRVALVAL